jgi:hypothetical protein
MSAVPRDVIVHVGAFTNQSRDAINGNFAQIVAVLDQIGLGESESGAGLTVALPIVVRATDMATGYNVVLRPFADLGRNTIFFRKYLDPASIVDVASIEAHDNYAGDNSKHLSIYTSGATDGAGLQKRIDIDAGATAEAGRVVMSARLEIAAGWDLYLPNGGTVYGRNAANDNWGAIAQVDARNIARFSAPTITVANDGAYFLGAAANVEGLLLVLNDDDNALAEYWVRGTSNETAIGPYTVYWDVTKDTGAKTNVYYDAVGDGTHGAGYYLQNKRGGERTYKCFLLGM